MQTTISRLFSLLIFISFLSCQQKETANTSIVTYGISFENAVHHEAEINVSFTNVKPGKFAFRMSRTSPGRYALHEFAKNVYNVKATNSKGESLEIMRPDPYQWTVENHDGTVNVSYTLFANRADGTYSQVDESHAHLNIPATFMYADSHAENSIKVNFTPRKDLGWKIATQLKKETENVYSAANLQYFMDSPTELSNHAVRSFEVASNNKNYTIKLAIHDDASQDLIDQYFEQVKAVVIQEKAVFGELPDFDFGEYTFLACYVANASGDGMEHRNSTILTSTRGLANGGFRNIGTVSHEFFHAWNVERIRPDAVEPFSFSEANMSGELWFAEGFTSYYTNFILCRAGIISVDDYINSLNGTFNYVWNSPGTQFFNPIEMSYQAPFVDAARSVDPVNRTNTFISYYSYGSVLGLALDLSLRNEPNNLNLDDYMKAVWKKHGKPEIPYTVKDLHTVLNDYAGKEFGDNFFNNFVYASKMPNYSSLFKTVGIELSQNSTKAYFGPFVSNNKISGDVKIGSPAYKANLERGDEVLTINGQKTSDKNTFSDFLAKSKVGDEVSVAFKRFGKEHLTKVVLEKDPRYQIQSYEKIGKELTDEIMTKRNDWLRKK